MSGDVTAAVIGLGGAVLGSLVVYRVAILDRRQELVRDRAGRDAVRAEAQAVAEEQRAARARIAARLLQSELAVARWRLQRAERSNTFWREGFELPLADWQLYRETVAEHMKPADWWKVSACYRSLDSTERQAVLARKLTSSPKPHLTESTIRQISVSLRNLEAAIGALEAFSMTATVEPSEADETHESDETA
jgi:hypothetical protein